MRNTAQWLKNVRSFGLRIAGRHDTNTHDLGFLYTLSCGGLAADREQGCPRFFTAGRRGLLERFHEKARIIQAWETSLILNRQAG